MSEKMPAETKPADKKAGEATAHDAGAAEAGATIAALKARLGYAFRDERLLYTALRHSSYAHEHSEGESYERLEFLGDAVLDLVVAEHLYAETDAPEGTLTQRRAQFVSEEGLFAAGRALIGPLVNVGAALQKAHRRAPHKSIVADVMEALIGAVFIDGGLDAARTATFALLGDIPRHIPEVVHAKTALQERTQAACGALPAYHVVREGGPDHAPRFIATVRVANKDVASAPGESQKRATTNAAEAALHAIADYDDAALAGWLRS